MRPSSQPRRPRGRGAAPGDAVGLERVPIRRVARGVARLRRDARGVCAARTADPARAARRARDSTRPGMRSGCRARGSRPRVRASWRVLRDANGSSNNATGARGASARCSSGPVAGEIAIESERGAARHPRGFALGVFRARGCVRRARLGARRQFRQRLLGGAYEQDLGDLGRVHRARLTHGSVATGGERGQRGARARATR